MQALSNAITICDRVGKKPTAATAQALKKLFPSSTSTPVSEMHRKRVFDPTAECVFSNEKKKKKAVRSRATTVKFVFIKNYAEGLPKNKNRKELLDGKCTKKIEIYRTMNADQVKAKVLREFTSIGISVFSYLNLDGGIRFTISTQQNLDGNGVITSAKKKNGNIVYITDHTPVAILASNMYILM